MDPQLPPALHGVDTDTKRPTFARKVARHLDLPAKKFSCGASATAP
ncbi:hypothetical protein [Nocardioides ungokensis]|nr:hypothetical protein [Nocardioides ungokensis]